MSESDNLDLDTPVVMFKVLKDEHLSSFVDEGRLYMRTLGYFRHLEDKNSASRGDEFEGVDHVYLGYDAKLSFHGVPIEAKSVKLKIWNEFNLDMSVFSMGTISIGDLIDSKGIIEFSKKYLEFGNKVVLFSGAGLVDFLTRVENSVKHDNEFTSHPHYRKFARKVEYIDSDQSAALGIFKKIKEYSWQYEWRLAIHNHSKPEIFQDICLGDLSSLCSVIDTLEFVKNPIIISDTG